MDNSTFERLAVFFKDMLILFAYSLNLKGDLSAFISKVKGRVKFDFCTSGYIK